MNDFLIWYSIVATGSAIFAGASARTWLRAYRDERYKLGVKDQVITAQDEHIVTLADRMTAAETDADRLAVIVNEYLTMIDRASSGENPAMMVERLAIRFHEEQLKLRPPSNYG